MGINVRLEGGPLHGTLAPVEDGQDELRIVLSGDTDARLGAATPEHVYRRIDAGTFIFDRTGTIRDRVPVRPPSRLTTRLLAVGSSLAPRLRMASVAQLLLLLLVPYLLTLSLEARYLTVIACGLLLGLLGFPAFAMFELRNRGLRVSRLDQAIGIGSLTASMVGFILVGVAMNGR